MPITDNDNKNDDTATGSVNNENNPEADISFTLVPIGNEKIITGDDTSSDANNVEHLEGGVPSSRISKGGGGKTH